jgi:hypothetical protein
VPFSTSSRGRLTEHDLGRFPGETLFDRVGRAVCHAGCLPRKELFEAWEVARRVRRVVRGGRVVDLCGGHGMLGQFMLLLDDSSPGAIVVDTAVPQSAARVQQAIVKAWPRLAGRVEYVAAPLDSVDLRADDVVVSSHACGNLTDQVLERACRARAAVAVLPCCHDMAHTSRRLSRTVNLDHSVSEPTPGRPHRPPGGSTDPSASAPTTRVRLEGAGDPGVLAGWVDRALAIDILRARWLEARGYQVRTQTIPHTITPKNRLLIGTPRA